MEISPASRGGEVGNGDDVNVTTSPTSSSSSDSPSSSTLPPSSIQGNGSNLTSQFDDDEDVCRICRNPGDSENPLRYPCACSGSIKFVHQDCLLQWLNHSNARQCEVCKHAFSFSPVYAENAPARLSFHEFLVGIAMKAFHVLQFFLRLSFVLSVWLLIIPFITFWIWRLAFVRSFSEALRLFVDHISASVVLTDCLHGFLLSASIVFIFLGATSLRDYFRHLRELGGQDGDREDEADRNGNRRRPPIVQDERNDGGIANGEEGGVAGEIARRNAENVADPWEVQAARLEAHVEQMFDGMDDGDGADDVPFDELVGMQGPLFHLVENAFTVLASNMTFLGAVIFVPFTIGRFILYQTMIMSYRSNIDTLDVDPFVLRNMTSGLIANFTREGHNATRLIEIAGTLGLNLTWLAEFPNSTAPSTADDLFGATSPSFPRFSDTATLTVGYAWLLSMFASYFCAAALFRYARGEPVSAGRMRGIASVAEAVPSALRQAAAAASHLMTMVKVAFLLAIELGVFPLMCGWWLDVCTVRMFGKSVGHRAAFFYSSPLASSLLHWVVGIVYMLQVSLFVSLLRGVLRPGVLYFLRDPADPNYNPFRDLIDDPIHKHARRVLLSVAVYGSLIVLLVFLPVKFAVRAAPSVFPLDVSVADPFTEVPADVLLFQICIPFAAEHFRVRSTVRSVLRCWFEVAGWALGLTEFLLVVDAPAPAPDADHNDDNDADEGGDSDYGFAFRVVVLLVVAWVTLLLLNSSLVVAPVVLGRAVFEAIPLFPFAHGVRCNDLYAFVIGSYAIWTAVAGVRYSAARVRSRWTLAAVGHAWRWTLIGIKSCLLLSVWIFIIPVLIGLLFELLVIVPLRVPVDESPVFLLYQDWALGLIFLKIWTRLVMLDHVVPLVDDTWRTKFQTVRNDGFSRLQGMWVLREIVLPIVMKLLTALCVPYVLARGVFPVLGYPLVINSAVYRFAWLGCLCASVVCFCARSFHAWFTNLHNSIRDDRYLIGRRLHDYGEAADPQDPPLITTTDDVHHQEEAVAVAAHE